MKGEYGFKEYMRYMILNVLGMLGLSCYILADTYFVSKALGTNGLAALNLAIPVYSFIHGSGLMFGVGGGTKYAILRGQKEHQGANEAFTNTLFAAVILSISFMLAGIFFSGGITGLLGAQGQVFGMTSIYLKVIMIFAPAFIMNDIFVCFVRNDGDPGLSMLAMLSGSLLNIVLDYIFMFPFQMGIFGAVLATGFSPVFSMLILSRHLKEKDHFRIVRKWPSYRLIGTAVSLGAPSLIAEAASGIVIIMFNFLIMNREGNVGVAAYGVIANLSLVVVSIYTGIAQGMQPLVSRAYGHGEQVPIKKLLQYALTTMVLISAFVYLCIFVFAGPIVTVFNSEHDPVLARIAENGLKIYFLAVPFAGFNIIISMFFTAIENALPAQLITLLRGLVLIVPMAFLLAFLAGLNGVWMTFPVTEGIVSLLGILILLSLHRSGHIAHTGSTNLS